MVENTLPKKILVCEDDECLIQLLQMVLEGSGYAFVGAHDGEAGLESFYAERPDVMILDIDMPRKDGFQVLQEIRDAGALNGTKVFFLSGKEKKADLERARQLGAFAYMIKPFNCEALVEWMGKALDQSSPVKEILKPDPVRF